MKSFAYAMTSDDWREVGRVASPWLILFVLVGGFFTVENYRHGKPKPPVHGAPVAQQSPTLDVQASRVP